jgi:hypothetical protein
MHWPNVPSSRPLGLAVFCLGTIVATAAVGQPVPTTQPTTAPAVAATTEPATVLPEAGVGASAVATEVVVTGRDSDLVGVADTSNQGTIGSDEIDRRPLLRPAEVLEAIPGLVITQHSGPGKANQYFLRGFQLDHGTDFAVSLEGVPQNLPTNAHGQGYTDLNDLIPELVDGIDYRKGPYYGDVGDFSLAGSADIRYVDALPQGFASLSGGMYGYGRSLVADSAKVGSGNLLFGFEVLHEDGPWDVPDAYTRLNGITKYSAGTPDGGASVTALFMHGGWNATNQVAPQAIDEGLISTYGSLSPTDGGRSDRYTLVAESHDRDAAGATKVEAYAAQYDLQLWNDFTYFLNNPVQGDQFEQRERRVYGGAQASHTFFGHLLGGSSDTTVGVQARSDDVRPDLYNTEDRQITSVVETSHVVETTAGFYVENRTQWLDWFRTDGSLREDYYNFHVNANVAANSGNRNASILSPKLNLVFGPWHKTELYLSGGYGYHSNDARSITGTVVPSTLLPASHVNPLTRGEGAEVGGRTTIVPGLQSTLSLFALDLNSEQVFDGDTAESVPSGPTRRIGLEFGNYYDVTPYLTLDGDLSMSRARFTDHEAAGDYVPESPDMVFQAGVTFHDVPQCPKLFGSVRVRSFGPRALTQNDSVQSNSSTIINAEVGYHFTKNLTFTTELLNVGDVKTDDIQYYYQYRLPGQPAAGVSGTVVHPAEPFEARFALTYDF